MERDEAEVQSQRKEKQLATWAATTSKSKSREKNTTSANNKEEERQRKENKPRAGSSCASALANRIKLSIRSAARALCAWPQHPHSSRPGKHCLRWLRQDMQLPRQGCARVSPTCLLAGCRPQWRQQAAGARKYKHTKNRRCYESDGAAGWLMVEGHI